MTVPPEAIEPDTDFGKVAYDAYLHHVGYRSIRGERLTAWSYCPGCGVYRCGIDGLCGDCRKAADLLAGDQP